ncbi:MAG: carbohydrate ABC transporter permease [Planctomycetota bacterium]
MQKATFKSEFPKYFLVLFVLATAFYPLFIMVVISFKTNTQYQQNPWFFDAPNQWRLQNWVDAWNIVETYIANSIVTSVAATALSMVMVILTGYVLGRHRFIGRNLVYYIIIASMFLPGTAATLVTMFWLIKSMGGVNTLWAIIVVTAATGQVAGVFLLTEFVKDIPKELFESAEIDGAGHLRQIFNVVLPLSGPILATIAIMKFLGVWNNVILPLVVLRDDHKLTLTVGLLRLEGEYVKQWGEMMAGYTIASLPLVLLFMFTMRWFVRGLAAGAIKG